MKDIFTYINYRQYLREYYDDYKQKTSYFSYRYFSQKAGIKSPVFLKLVTEGTRNLTRPMIEKFCTALKLSEKQSTYFRNLVLFNQASTAAEKQEHYAVMRSLAHAVDEQIIQSNLYDFYDQWYHSVIRELICQSNFNDNFQKLATTVTPAIKPRQARNAVALLLKLGLVSKKKDGSYTQIHRAISTGNAVVSMAIRSFNRQMIELAQNSLDATAPDERHASGITMGISKPCYDVLATEIAAFKERVVSIVNADEQSNQVYQLNIQLFPVSKNVDKTGQPNVRETV